MGTSEVFDQAAQRRVEWLTLGLGAAAALVMAAAWGWRQAVGVAAGAALSWLNYRWLKQGVKSLVQDSLARADAPQVRPPRRLYVKLLARVALLLAVVYVILIGSSALAGAVLAGLFCLVAAVLLELVYELARGLERKGAS
ncbi:MAG TPA: ATP synthase subunit I [Candidatus Acidoferrales bacterium]|jgi:hypothetical protein|nr:ATP synthase subunit I [Candidatus Acidoferrales bacterium]